MMVKPWSCDYPAGVAVVGLWGVLFHHLPVVSAVINLVGS